MPPGDAANDRASIRRARDVQRLRLANRTRPALALTPSRVEPGLDEVLAAAAADPIAVTAEDADAAAPEPELVAASDPPSNQAETVLVDTPIVAEASGRERAWAARMAELGPVPPVPVAEMRPDVLGWGANRREAEDRIDTIPAIDPDFRLPFR